MFKEFILITKQFFKEVSPNFGKDILESDFVSFIKEAPHKIFKEIAQNVGESAIRKNFDQLPENVRSLLSVTMVFCMFLFLTYSFLY